MNKKIFNNTRFCPKGDIEANWNKAVGFVPLDKEIIIYKADKNHPVARFKIGDGKTVVQDLPFAGADMAAIEQLIDEKGELLIEYVDNAVQGLATEEYVNEAVAAIKVAEQIQADWNQNDETAKDYIKNKPIIPVISEDLATEEYVNNSINGLATEEYVNEAVAAIEIPEVDQTYSSESVNAQSGVAIDSVLKPIEQKNDEQDTKIAAIESKVIAATKDNILSIFN